MKTAERVFGFASCALGLLPLIEPARAQQNGPVACQSIATGIANGGGTGPIVTNFGGQRFLVCGYSLAVNGSGTALVQLLTGYGSACATSNGLTQTALSPQVFGSQMAVSVNGLAYITPPGSSICVNANTNASFASAELSYSLQ